VAIDEALVLPSALLQPAVRFPLSGAMTGSVFLDRRGSHGILRDCSFGWGAVREGRSLESQLTRLSWG
jgi:hypothetical protein